LCDFRVRRNLFLPAVFSKARTHEADPPKKEESGVNHEHDRH
jgi:hypothetical protein